MNMPFIDLQAQYRRIKDDVDRRVIAVMEHGKYILGPEITELETKLAEFVGVKHALTCSSGTDALVMPLMAYDIKPGDAIFCPAFTFIATAEVVAMLGATPVFVDICETTFNMDPGKLDEAVQQVKAEGTLRPRGVIPVDLFGLAADYDAIMPIAEREGLFVIEDAAQGLGADYKGRVAGSMGHVAATSFYPAKPLGGYGDSGAIFTNDDHLAHLLRSIRVHGQGEDKYNNDRVGINGRMDSMQAAVLIPKLEIFPDEIQARQKVASWYDTHLEGLVETPFTPPDNISTWAQYSVLSDRRDDLRDHLGKAGIPTAVFYPKPLHQQAAFAHLDFPKTDLARTEDRAKRIFSLPMHPYMTEQQVITIAEAIRSAV